MEVFVDMSSEFDMDSWVEGGFVAYDMVAEDVVCVACLAEMVDVACMAGIEANAGVVVGVDVG